jgi:hypothetical protein
MDYFFHFTTAALVAMTAVMIVLARKLTAQRKRQSDLLERIAQALEKQVR